MTSVHPEVRQGPKFDQYMSFELNLIIFKMLFESTICRKRDLTKKFNIVMSGRFILFILKIHIYSFEAILYFFP